MRTIRIPAALFAFVFFASTALFSQSSNGTISGTAADATGAVVPGVTVTATNNATGIVTTVLSNDAGVYNFASLLPGTYKLSAMIPGFQTQTFNDVQLGTAGQLRLNFALEVAGGAQSVEVPVDAEMGRGNGQIQILTRSGTNEFRRSATWNVQNSALDANTWLNNSRRVTPAWRNGHDYSIAFGGPIKKNKTFFYTVWNQLIV